MRPSKKVFFAVSTIAKKKKKKWKEIKISTNVRYFRRLWSYLVCYSKCLGTCITIKMKTRMHNYMFDFVMN